jgi:hypothetical protein
LLISLVMYGNPSASINPVADYNGDGVLDLADIEALVNAILGK